MPKFVSRNGETAVTDMQLPTHRGVVSDTLLRQDPGIAALQYYLPVLSAMCLGLHQVEQRKQEAASDDDDNASASAAATSSSQSGPLFQPVPKPGRNDWLAEHEERGQTTSSYLRGQFRARPHGSFSNIAVVVLGNGVPFLKELQKYVSCFFQCNVTIVPVEIDVSKFQTRVTEAGTQLLCRPLQDLATAAVSKNRDLSRCTFATIAVTMFDISPDFERYNFVYGHASLSDGHGVFSLARFHPLFNGEAVTSGEHAQQIIFKRACKVICHELMHICGLRHCINFVCNINGCNHCGELERQPLINCPCCEAKMLCAFAWDLQKRYADMIAVSRECGFAAEAEKWQSMLEVVNLVLGDSSSSSSNQEDVAAAASSSSASSTTTSLSKARQAQQQSSQQQPTPTPTPATRPAIIGKLYKM